MLKIYVEILCQHMKLNIEDIEPERRVGYNCDEIEMVEMAVALEKEFGIEIPMEILEAYPTVSELWAYIKKGANL